VVEKGKGLLAVWADIEKDYETKFRKWHNCQHVAERVSIQGFLAGYRYCGIEGAPDYLMFYETRDSKVLGSDPYLNSVNNPTPWTQKSITHLRNTVRNIYNEICGLGEEPSIVSPYLYASRFGLREESSKEVIDLYKNKYMPRVMEMPEVSRVRLYESDTEISGIGTDEKKLHGAELADYPFLVLIEVSNPEVVSSESWKRVQEDSDISGLVISRLEGLTSEKYWLDFAMPAPMGQ
jgi:hypothetical protein